jgi:hypothetical protein
MRSHTEALDVLIKSAGFYTGYGVNHEDQQFKGLFEMTPVVNNNGVHIKYRATGLSENETIEDVSLYSRNNQLFNEEDTLIAYNNKNKLCLWTLNINVPMVCMFDLRRFRRIADSKNILIFGFGDKKDEEHFREEITIEIWNSGSIAYNYYWGEPGGNFLSRSTIIMRKL